MQKVWLEGWRRRNCHSISSVSAILLRVGIMQRVMSHAYPDVANIRDADLEAFFELLPSNGAQMDKECGCGGKNHAPAVRETCSQETAGLTTRGEYCKSQFKERLIHNTGGVVG